MFAGQTVRADEGLVTAGIDLFPARAHVQQMDEEVVGQLARPVREHTVLRPAVIGTQNAQAADQHRHLRRRQAQKLRPVDQQLLGRHIEPDLQIVAEAVGLGFQYGEALDVGLVLACVGPARGEGHLDRVTGRLRRLLDADGAAQHDQVGDGNDALAVKVALDGLIHLQHMGQLRRLVDLPRPLRMEPQPAAVGPAAVVRPAIGRRRRPGRRDQIGHGQG